MKKNYKDNEMMGYYQNMFSDIDKILMKYFKKKKESPLATLIKLMKKNKGIETQKILDKERKNNK